MENSQTSQQNVVVRKIRKIKRPKISANSILKSPEAPEKAGSVSAETNKGIINKPKINFANPGQGQIRNLPQSEVFKQDTLYNQNGGIENIRFVSETNQNYLQSNNIAELLKNKTILLLMGISAIFGLFIGAGSFSGAEASKHGLDWVVANPDVPAGRSRCGLVEQHQGCVLYIMNPEKRNVTGKDFYSVAAKWTKRERYQIETGNMHYGSKQIKPGHIAQINIPPL